MAFKGSEYSVGFDQLYNLMWTGTDVIAVEKSGTVTKMIPFTNKNGIAFIQSQGFVSEYGVALARLAAGHRQAAYYYLSSPGTNNSKDKAPIPKEFTCNLGALTDFDSSGLEIWAKIPDSIRLGKMSIP